MDPNSQEGYDATPVETPTNASQSKNAPSCITSENCTGIKFVPKESCHCYIFKHPVY